MTIKVLLVDDEKDFVNALAKFLRNRDLDVTIAYNGNEALDLYKQMEFDIVVLDVLMPGKNGIETLKEMRAINADTYTIVLSGHATLETAMETMQMDAFDFLVKPVILSELYDKIVTAFQDKKLRDAKRDGAGS